MSYRPAQGDIIVMEFDDGSRVWYGFASCRWRASYPPITLRGNAIFDDVDEAIHWLRCRGMARRLVRTGRFAAGAWKYSTPEGDPAPS